MTSSNGGENKLQFKNIGLVVRQNTADVKDAVRNIVSLLSEKNINISIEANLADTDQELVKRGCNIPSGNLEKNSDLIIVLGGDGTLLSVARKAVVHKIPLVGINQGRLGFMTDIPKEHMLEPLTRILEGDFIPEERILMEAQILRNDDKDEKLDHALALNDVVFSRGAMGQLIEFEVFIDGTFVYTQRSDGLIVSTPTGSTAYSLSAGGPILHPTLPAITLVPICPQSMSNRPIVVNDDVEVQFLLTKGNDAQVHFDGQSRFDLHESDRVNISRYKNKLRILHPRDYDYYNTLRQKLHWGGRLI